MVTIIDVACEAEVSTATVSRTLNYPEKVRATVRDRVYAAINALGYVPHGAARALATSRSYTIGAILPILKNPVFAECIETLQKVISVNGYSLLIANSGHDLDRELRDAAKLIERGIDGLMLMGAHHDIRLYKMLGERSLPFINTWTWDANSKYPCIGFDNHDVASKLTRYLIDLGHRSFGVITGVNLSGRVFNDRTALRLKGTEKALAQNGTPLLPEMVVSSSYSINAAREAMSRLLVQPNPPTAVICHDDVLAFGAAVEAKALGFSVPEDISIAGFDDIELAKQASPPLTTMFVPGSEIGQRVAEYLMARIGGSTPPPTNKLDINLVVRESTAPPRKSDVAGPLTDEPAAISK